MDYRMALAKINSELSANQQDIDLLTKSYEELSSDLTNASDVVLNTFETLKSAELVQIDTYDDEDFVFNVVRFYDELKTEKCLDTDNQFFVTLLNLMFKVEDEEK